LIGILNAGSEGYFELEGKLSLCLNQCEKKKQDKKKIFHGADID
jgi:hypothetical protein